MEIKKSCCSMEIRVAVDGGGMELLSLGPLSLTLEADGFF